MTDIPWAFVFMIVGVTVALVVHLVRLHRNGR